MATPDYSLEAMQLRRDEHYIYFENKYITWRHNAVTGLLDGAFVRYGSNGNLLVKPVETVIQLMDQETCLTYNLERQEGAVVKAEGDTIVTEYLLAARGDEVKIRHEVVYKPWGSGLHAVTISAGKRVNNLFSVQLCSTAFAPAMDQFTWRPTLEAGLGTWAQNNTPTWIPLNSGARRQDMYIAHKRLPLCFMVIQRGVEGIEFALGDNLEEWQAFRPENMLPSQQMEFGYDTKLKGYRTFVSPYHGREDGFIEGEHTFHFNMTLPFVREKMSPLRPGGHFFPIGNPFEERWPDEEFTAARAEAGMDLFRLHNDGDRYGNGIFWRDAAYPPYPADEMEKMDAAIALTHKYNMKVVPYFSVKELHPDVEDFGKYGEEWARRDEPNGYLRVNRSSGTRIFGYQMCLKSGWMKKRLDTIREVLDNHAFDGIYYDWCCGLECFGSNHCGYWHWDNDEFMELLNETRNICGREKEMYLHTSHVISLGSENLATLLLTEEAEFPRIGPEMFTPHVHFLNTAPRQICNMLPLTYSDDDRRRMVMCALLHHATVDSPLQCVTDTYRENRYWMDTVVNYNRHHAPGEGWTLTDNEEVGFAYYEDENGGRLHVFANLSDREVTVNWKTPKDGRTGTITLPPMKITVEKQ